MEAATAAPPELDPEPQPQEPPDGDPDGYPGDLAIEGEGQLSFGVGGKRPTTSSLRIVGGKVDVEGQFDKGERLVLHVEIEVGEVAFKDEQDGKTGQVIGCERRHRARITAVERV